MPNILGQIDNKFLITKKKRCYINRCFISDSESEKTYEKQTQLALDNNNYSIIKIPVISHKLHFLHTRNTLASKVMESEVNF